MVEEYFVLDFEEIYSLWWTCIMNFIEIVQYIQLKKWNNPKYIITHIYKNFNIFIEIQQYL